MKLQLIGYALLFSILSSLKADAQLLHPSKANTKRTTTQQAEKQYKEQCKQMLIRQLTASAQEQTANKTTSTIASERLIAENSYEWQMDTGVSGIYIWKIVDSADHKYSGQRGSYFNLNTLNFDKYYLPSIYLYVGYEYGHGLEMQNNKNIILSDSTHFYAKYMTAPFTYAFGLVSTTHSQFDANNNTYDFSNYSNTSTNDIRHVNTFTSSDNISSMLYLENTTGTWDTTTYRDLGYTTGQLVFDSINIYPVGGGVGTPAYKYDYTYNAYGSTTRISQYIYEVSSSTWHEAGRWDAEYYANHQLKKLTYFAFPGWSSPQINYVDTFGWTTGVNYYTYYEARTYTSGVAYYDVIITKHISPINNLPDTTYTKTYNLPSTIPQYDFITAYTYDSYQLPVKAEKYLYNSLTSAYDSFATIQRFYYETYTRDNTGTDMVNAVDDGIQLYPNPSIGAATLILPKKTEGWNILITDITGKVVQAMDANSGAASIDISDNSNGLYLIRITNKQTNKSVTQKLLLSK